MKPTQQEIIELAREAGIREQMPAEDDLPAVWMASTPEIERLVHLSLERFGAGGGELVRYEFQSADGTWHPFIDARHYENTVADGRWPIRALYTHPSPTDLRAEYLRGLEDAKKIASNYGPSRPIVTKTPSQRIVGRWEGEQAASAGIADDIERAHGINVPQARVKTK